MPAPLHAAQVIARYEPDVRRWLAARVLCAEDAEDLTQDVMVAIITGWPRFRGRSSVRTWVYAVARNVLANHRRAGSRRRVVPWDDAAAGTPVPDMDTRVALEIAVRSLPTRQQELFHLRFTRHLNVAELAARLDRSEGTVKYQLYELRRILAAMLGL